MDKEHFRQLVWESLLDADFSARYFGHLAGRLQHRERVITIVIGVLSCGAFVTLITKFQVNYLPQVLSLLSATFSVVLANLKLGKAAALSAAIHSKWSTVRNEYEMLWGQIGTLSAQEVADRWRALASEHKKEDETAAQEFRLSKRLAAKCQQDVMRSRRLVTA